MHMLFLAGFIAVAIALPPPDITGPTPPPVSCSNNLCNGKYDGNYEYPGNANYFLQCLHGEAYCQACWPLTLEFSATCNQCLYSKYDQCVTTQQWAPANPIVCPDKCPQYGPTFDGNIPDPSNAYQYVACWHGVTVGCIACPAGLQFSEKWNACLYEGKYITEPHQGGYTGGNGGYTGGNGGYTGGNGGYTGGNGGYTGGNGGYTGGNGGYTGGNGGNTGGNGGYTGGNNGGYTGGNNGGYTGGNNGGYTGGNNGGYTGGNNGGYTGGNNGGYTGGNNGGYASGNNGGNSGYSGNTGNTGYNKKK